MYSSEAPQPEPVEQMPGKAVRGGRKFLTEQDIERQRRLTQQLDRMELVPLGQKSNLNELERQDKEVTKQMKLAKEIVKMKKLKPISPSMRWYRRPIYPYLHKGSPVRQLTIPKKKRGGRNHHGRITVRHQGGGHKRRIRIIDFFRVEGGEHTVQRIEYDPNRSSHIALLKNNETGGLSYIAACVGMRAGDVVESFRKGIPQRIMDKMGGETDPSILASHIARKGNCLPLRNIPLGTVIHNIGITRNGPAKFCRAAGTYGRLYEKHEHNNRAVVRLKSGEYRYVALDACATVGIVSNPAHQHRMLGKAGRARNLGIRPTVRGLAMNNVDHPHGGGRGKSKGNKHSQSPWGVLSKGGFKTRRGKNVNRMLVKERPRGKEKR
ncbi:large ribosomal subunit protein uL2m [Trichomonascus vanleenenianus]|uniref:mitochondrial 54S ribosomal protein uL2m RML2 n=1 Tax=Trichomonascus vanleenenianus TaxID=2268995 RepID=UPI003ECA9BBE